MAQTEIGKTIDVLCGFTPVNMATAANTGARINMENYQKVTFIGYFATGGAGEAPTMTLQEHTAASAGTSADLAVIDTYYTKSEATLDGDEAWTEVTQTAAATVTNATWDDALEALVVFTVDADELSDGYDWVSVNVADVGSTAKVGTVLAVATELRVQRTPQNLPQPNA